MSPLTLSLGLVLLLALEVPQCLVAENSQRPPISSLLHELLELRIDGCPILARGRRKSEDKDLVLHISLDPMMCVDGDQLRGSWASSRYDPIAKNFYVAIPVAIKSRSVQDLARLMLRNRPRLRSIGFASVAEVSASTDLGSVFVALGFVWSQGEDVGYLRLGCDLFNKNGANRSDAECKIDALVSNLRSGNFSALSRVLLSATLWTPTDGPVVLDYRLTVNHSRKGSTQRSENLVDYSLNSRLSQEVLPSCVEVNGLQPQPEIFVRLGECSAAVYSVGRAYGEGRFLVETPICYAGSVGAGNEADYGTGKHRLTLGFANFSVADETLLSEVTKQLEVAGFKVKHPVTFMTLWAARHKVSGLLAGRYEVGSLRAATHEGEVDAHAAAGQVGISSGAVQVTCQHVTSCRYLLSQITANPVDFWRHIAWDPTYKLPLNLDEPSSGHCVHSPDSPRFSVAMAESEIGSGVAPGVWEATAWREACTSGPTCKYRQLPDGRHFVVVQQRTAGTVSFDRPWSDYETGFGDGNDFWIGLKAIHLLSSHGVKMRVEMRLWNGTNLLAEYADFRVGDASTKYLMTYREFLSGRSNVAYDAMHSSKGMAFTTYDRDNDLDPGSCSLTWGRGGWWFDACYKFYPNGLFPTTITKDWKYMTWVASTEVLSLRQVWIMLQI